MTRILELALKDSAARWLADHAREEGVSEGEIVRRAIQLYFRRDAWPLEREDFADESQTPSEPARTVHWREAGTPTRSEVALEPGSRTERAAAAPCPRSLPPAPESAAQPLLFPIPEASPEASSEPEAPWSPVLLIPCIPPKKGGPREWGLSPTQLAAWEELFLDMDVLGALKLAQGWLLSNHLKTHSGMKRFCFNWLVRAQNRGKYPRRVQTREVSQRPTLKEVYGFESWEEWEARLRRSLAPDELEVDLESLGELRRAWEARYGMD